MTALFEDAHCEESGIIERLIAENEALRMRLVECQAAVVRWASRAEQAEDLLALRSSAQFASTLGIGMG